MGVASWFGALLPRPQRGRAIFLGNLSFQSQNSSPHCSKSGLVSAKNSIFTAWSPGQGLFVPCHDFYTCQSSSTLLSMAPQRCWINFLFLSCSSEPQLYQGIFREADTASRQCCLLKRAGKWGCAIIPVLLTTGWQFKPSAGADSMGWPVAHRDAQKWIFFSTYIHIKWASLLQSRKSNVLPHAPK